MPDEVTPAAPPTGPIRSLLSSPYGDVSAKRVIGLALALCLVIAVGADIAGRPIHDHLLDLIAGVVTAFMAAATADHFGRKDCP